MVSRHVSHLLKRIRQTGGRYYMFLFDSSVRMEMAGHESSDGRAEALAAVEAIAVGESVGLKRLDLTDRSQRLGVVAASCGIEGRTDRVFDVAGQFFVH